MNAAATLQRTLKAIEKKGQPPDIKVIRRQYCAAISDNFDDPNALLYLADWVIPYLGATQAFIELLQSPFIDLLCIEGMFFTRIVGTISDNQMREVMVMLRQKRPDVYNVICWRLEVLSTFFLNAEEALEPIACDSVH